MPKCHSFKWILPEKPKWMVFFIINPWSKKEPSQLCKPWPQNMDLYAGTCNILSRLIFNIVSLLSLSVNLTNPCWIKKYNFFLLYLPQSFPLNWNRYPNPSKIYSLDSSFLPKSKSPQLIITSQPEYVRNLLTTQKGTAKIRLGFPVLVNLPVLVLHIVHSVPLVLLSTVTLELALFTAWMTPSKRSLSHLRMVFWEQNVMLRGSLIHQLQPLFLITFPVLITHLIVIIGFSSRQIPACPSRRVSDHRR